MNVETPAQGRGLENSAGGRVPSQDTTNPRHQREAKPLDVIERRRPAHELRADLWDLWREGFRAGQEAAQRRIDRAEHDADHWYYVANNTAEVRAQHEATLRQFDVARARAALDTRIRELDRAEASA